MNKKIAFDSADIQETGSALLFFQIASSEAYLLGNISRKCGCGDQTFTLFGNDDHLSFIDQFREQEAEVQKALIELAHEKGVDDADEEAMTDFLHSVETAARNLVPVKIWEKLNSIGCKY